MNLNILEKSIPPNLRSMPEWPEDLWPTLFDQMPYCLLIFDWEGRLLLANDEAARRLCLNDLNDFLWPESWKSLKVGAFQLELRSQRGQTMTLPSPADGNPITFLLRHLPYGEGLILATEQSRAFSALNDGTGALAETAAMACEVRRQVTGPLAGIELYASIVGQELEEAGDSSLAGLIEQIHSGVREVNEYLTSFNSMAEPLHLNLEPHKLMEIVDEALGAMNGVFKERQIGVLVIQKDLILEVDRGLMVQLLLNLFLNAVEAMPDGGRIFVEFDTDKPGLVEIVVTDTGPGVPMALMKRIFSPFHTTKDQPLGLGLPVSLRIAEAHQGSLIVGSDLNMGARAVISLPHMPEQLPSGSLN